MSIDLDWSTLDADLTASAIAFFTSAFQSVSRPNFIGEIKVTNFSFGDKEPIVEVLDVRDIYKEFLEVDRDEEDEEQHQEEEERMRRRGYDDEQHQQQQQQQQQQQRQFERDQYTGSNQLPIPQRSNSIQDYSNSNGSLPLLRSIVNSRPSSSLFSPGLNSNFSPNHSNTPSLSNHSINDHPPQHYQSRRTSRQGPFRQHQQQQQQQQQQNYQPPPSNFSHPSHLPSTSQSSFSPHARHPSPTSSSYTSSPSLQIHLKVTYKGNLSIGLSTSLIINYPAENFMQLPLDLNVTSLAFEGLILIAFEGGERRRIHLCFLDPKDEEGPSLSSEGGGGETPGSRLLRGAVVESEVGQREKHVLKNVGKVEKFVLDVARRTLESEMIFP